MNGVILSAGIGSRLLPLTRDRPKSLISINNEILIETQIKNLKEIGVQEIFIVVGYLDHCFKYLEKKFSDITIIYNPLYKKLNNWYSLYLVKDLLSDTWIIEGDLYLPKQILDHPSQNSCYYTAFKNKIKDEWLLEFNSQLKLKNIVIGNDVLLENNYVTGGYVLSGVSFWNKTDCMLINSELKKIYSLYFSNSPADINSNYWDQIILENHKSMQIDIKITRSDDWFEIDTIEDYSLIPLKNEKIFCQFKK